MLFFPTKAAMDRAHLMRILEDHDAGKAGNDEPRPHHRPDEVMIYSMLTECHRQLVTVSRAVWALVVIGLVMAWRLIF